MAPPVTYAAWCTLLEKFERGSNDAVEEMDKSSFVPDAGTAARFYARTNAAYTQRKQAWLAQFQRAALLQPYQSAAAFGLALRNGRQGLLPLQKFVAIKGLPQNLQQTLQKDLKDFVTEIKKSLKDHIPKTDKSRESLLLVINAFELEDTQPAIPASHKKSSGSNNDTIPPMGRKIIF